MCDVESYIYMPLLEEIGYMPKRKYSYGEELRGYAEMIAERFGLKSQAIFQTKVRDCYWDEEGKEWSVDMAEIREEGKEVGFKVKARFVISASGVLNFPKLPDLKGIQDFQGHNFHTSRWNYGVTGGSPSDPALVNLKDKNVGIIGTRATAIQAIPHLAKWAKHLYIFQRTPSAVDERGQQPTDPKWGNEMTKEKGWQRKRNQNFNSFIGNNATPGEENMVNDNWSKAPSYGALIGSPVANLDPAGIPAYIGRLHAMDLPRMERVRARVEQVVKDNETAEKLKAWYPTWCKRPCFHDDYLGVFNQPNMTLVDTEGQGVDGLSKDGVLYKGNEYKADVLIFSTGYRSPVLGNVSGRANMALKGRRGKTMDEN
jgi:cation diffusion facilitator CzcD-associated flavoprotein CzcO